ncbi:MAG: class I tRNA ligase family protein, partial [Methanobacteriaceae archaeon]
PVDEKGDFTEDAGKYANKFIKDANPEIISDLEDKGLLWKSETIHHRYGTCWRCKTPIIYLATEQWFLKVTEIKDKMLSEIDKVEWVPEWAGESRFRDWVENARDWTISRQRYWGIPIPVWACEDHENCGKIKVLGSVEELKELCINPKESIDNVDEGDLVHRPHVDAVKIKCDCGKDMTRIEDVLDVWIDSGVAGWASLYYPQEKDMFEEWFPYDFITEGHDQTRGWFYSQLGTGVIAMDQSPYKKVLMHGFTLDEDGRKMSKSLGNVVQPEEVIELYGADVLRFYLLWANKPWEDLKFVWDELNNIKKMFNILWNVYVFSTTYMALDEFNPNNCIYNSENGENRENNGNEGQNNNNIILRDEDKWILSRVNSLAKNVTEDLEKVFFHQATRRINYFILEDLSRWYVRLIRGRTWVEKDDPDKLGAYYTLYSVLKLLIKTMAPFAPYTTEDMYHNLVTGINAEGINLGNEEIPKESIHMENWEYDENAINSDLESQMDVVREVIEACARARDVARYKLRWPVSEIIVVSESNEVLSAVNSLANVIKDQSNTKAVITSNEFENVSYTTKPNLKTLGSKLRWDIKFVHTYINSIDGLTIKAKLEEEGKIIIEDENISNDDKKIVLEEGDLLFESVLPDDVVSAEFKCEISTSSPSTSSSTEKISGNVFVNTQLTDEILSEAMARELIRRIQDMRKDMDLDVEANIEVIVNASDKFVSLVENQTDMINNEVRALKIEFDIANDKVKNSNYYTKDWKIEDEELSIAVKEA